MRPGNRNQFAGTFAALAVLSLMAGASLADQNLGLSFRFPERLAANIEASPLLSGGSAAAERINGRLAALDAEAISLAEGCAVSADDTNYERNTDIVFAGPRFLSVTVQVNAFCPGAAHGAFYIEGFTFDLDNGEEVRWAKLFPPALIADRKPYSEHGFIIGSQALTDLYLKLAVALPIECRAAIASENAGFFRVWPDAKQRSLSLIPSGLSHANQACADQVHQPVDTLRMKQFSEALTLALSKPKNVPEP